MMTAEELALTSGEEVGRFSPYCVYLAGGDPSDVDAIREGYAGVQDEGSQLIARAVTVADVGEDSGRWLDMCAGPGGKAALIGSLADIDGAHLDAIEVSEHRAELIRKAVRDLPVTIHVADAVERAGAGLRPHPADAPCSGLGSLLVLSRSRWRRSPRDVDELVVLQKELLSQALRLVKPGGVVVYSTCSPHPAETTAVVADVLAEVEGARQLDARPLVTVGELEGELLGDGPHVRLRPHIHGTDAMFAAALTRD